MTGSEGRAAPEDSGLVTVYASIGNSDDKLPHACICFEVRADRVTAMKRDLGLLAAAYGQDSIAWAVAATEFIGPGRI